MGIRILPVVVIVFCAFILAGCGQSKPRRAYRELRRKTLSTKQILGKNKKGRVTHVLTEDGPPVIQELDDGRDLLVILGGVKLILPMRESSGLTVWERNQ